MQSYLTGVLLVQFFLYGFMAIAWAQSLPVAGVAVIDYGKILESADATKNVNLQIRKFQNKISEEVRTEELRLLAVEAKLKRERSRLGAKEFKIRRKNFRNQVLSAQKRGQERKRQLERAMANAMRQIEQTVILLVKEITKVDGYTLVVEKSQVLFAERALEITDKVLLKLNQNLRTVKVPKPK